ncbi:type II toxin-antitoxin system HicB family antitoxin [Lactobacillus johnsonii]|uniref:HicB family protein n=1 Tax=Lactobacillus johnsonii TaxID=33959 RepID=A0A9X7T7Q0_LACJH|nr:type II toxin-antitoxin system HicB family antitoxin [Lactobacillus johnsonii]QIA88536.1 HicB family protein [Lactobacillus johnsonii]
MFYFATFHQNDQNQYEVNFPDLEPYAATYGDTLEEALQSAHDSLVGYLLTAEDFNETVPKPTIDPTQLNVKLNYPDFMMPVEVNLKLEREKELNKLVKKTLTIPKYLNDLGKKNNINFSAILTNALKENLNLK